MSRLWAVLAALLLLTGLAFPAVAGAAEGDRGASLLQAVESGRRSCDELTAGDFEEIGEYVMERMMGSPRAHDSMDVLMRSMMGEGAERRMHALMGRRFAGCGGGRVTGQLGGMMGMMGGGADRFGAGGGMGMGSMMGGRPFDSGPGSMMSGTGTVDGDDDDMPAGMWIATLAILVLVGLAVIGAFWPRGARQGRGARTPLEILGQRYASGEIDTEEYSRRRSLLEGSL